MDWYHLVEFFHIIAAIMFVGGLFARQLVRSYANQTNDIRLFTTLSQAAGKIEKILVIPGSQAILVLGIILAFLGHYPILGFLQGSSRNWLLVSNILLVIIILLVPIVFVPRGKKFEPILQAALTKGEVTKELRAAMNDKVVIFAHIYEEIATIVIVALMVLKPF
jgi:uncharacterized membrane protein